MTKISKIKTYSELSRIPDYNDRYLYLKLNGDVGSSTFGFDRYLNQAFYKSIEWKRIRNFVILRDKGFDMGHADFPIQGSLTIHHMNPITIFDLDNDHDKLLNPEYLITVSSNTHREIHYGNQTKIFEFGERKKYDTSPWRKHRRQ